MQTHHQFQVPFLIATAMSLLIITATYAHTAYSDGGTHNINTTMPVGAVSLSNGTTLNMLSGSSVTGYYVGNINWQGLRVFDTSTLNLQSGSSITGGNAYMAGGAAFVEGINVWGNGKVNIHGGYVTGGIAECAGAPAYSRGIAAWENSTVNIYGGTITGGEADSAGYPAYAIGINSMSNSKVNIYGGYISAGYASSTWGQPAQSIGIVAIDSSIVTIYGTGFNFGYGPINQYSGRLTGTLADGTFLNTTFYQHFTGEIVLVPEPASAFLIGAGFFFARLRRRQS